MHEKKAKASCIELTRILLFLKGSETRTEWERNRLHQRAGVIDNETEKDESTGPYPRYPLYETDLFRQDCFRFIDRRRNTVGDVYVFFNLHDGEKKKTLFLLPNEHSGGIDFAGNDPNDVFLRWVPLPLPKQFPTQSVKVKTHVVINHPEDACDFLAVGSFPPVPVQWCKQSPILLLSRNPHIFLTGRDTEWCKEHFSGEHNTLGLHPFFQFTKDNCHRIFEAPYVER